ncbi:MAG: dephospho-CoA kinase [Ruminococcus sp.]|nr:dephospho-CoA kinase [Ruminococcus sp.]
MSKALVVGLTGPIGSGKSAVAKLFCENGYAHIDADKVAREVVKKGSPVLIELATAFGDDVINSDGTLNRRLLSQKAFSKDNGAQLLNSITHPAILKRVEEKISSCKADGYEKILYDAPLLFESKSDKLCEKIVCVIAKKSIRLERVKLRDNISESEIESRMNAQQTDSYYTEKSDFVIQNNSTLDKLREETIAVIKALDEVENAAF